MKRILKDRLLIEKISKTQSNSILDIVEDENGPLQGTVLKIGKLVEDIVEGDVILYRASDALEVTLDNKNLLILREYDIIAIL